MKELEGFKKVIKKMKWKIGEKKERKLLLILLHTTSTAFPKDIRKKEDCLNFRN